MSPRPPVDHAGRFRRLANMAAWLAEVSSSTVEELAERFDVSPDQVRRDLEVLMNATFGVDDEAFVHVSVDEAGEVYFWDKDVFTRQLRLRPAEALWVLAASESFAVLDDPSTSDALRSAIAKVRAAVEASDLVKIETRALDMLDVVRSAAARRQTVRMRYYAASTNEVTERDVDPYLVYLTDGQWYVTGYDHLRDATDRRFRVDGIIELEVTDRVFEPPADEVIAPDEAFTPGAATRSVTVRVPSSGRWVLEALANAEVVDGSDDDSGGGSGHIDVVLPVNGEAWLAQLLLRLGPEAEVLDPPDLREAGRDLARRLLAMYE